MTRTSFMNNLRSMKVKELQKTLANLQADLMRLRRYPKVEPKDTKREGRMRKDIARVKTVLTENGVKT